MTTSGPIRNSMKQTATVERTAAGALNPLGQPTPGAVSSSVVACRAWEETQEEVTGEQGGGGGGRWFTLSRWKMRVPLDADIAEDDRVTIGSTLLLVETPPIERHGHKLVTLEILQREIQHAPLPLSWGSLGIFWDSLELGWEDVA